MSCCPAESLPSLTAPVDYKPTGTKVDAGGTECYASGEGDTALLLFPDVWGWDSGRTRALADEFATQGYQVLVPKLLTPAFEGGTDGDGLPPDFDMGARGKEFGPWITTIPWAGIEPKVLATIEYAKSKGAARFLSVGCCWGGWAAFHTSAICKEMVAGVTFHPSCQLEGMFGGNVEELAKTVQCPFYFMPAGGDSPALYGPDGSLVKILSAAFPATKTRTFAEMSHGWVPRGDLSNEAVKRDVGLAMAEAAAYFTEALK